MIPTCQIRLSTSLFFNDTATTEIYTLSLHDALPISRQQRTVPVSAGLIRLHGDYLHGEYGDLDSDYVFVNLFAEPRGKALSYPAVHDLVARLRRRTGLEFGPHWCRHSAATRMLRDGVPVEVVSKILGHASVATT